MPGFRCLRVAVWATGVPSLTRTCIDYQEGALMACKSCGDYQTPDGQVCKPCADATDKLLEDLKK